MGVEGFQNQEPTPRTENKPPVEREQKGKLLQRTAGIAGGKVGKLFRVATAAGMLSAFSPGTSEAAPPFIPTTEETTHVASLETNNAVQEQNRMRAEIVLHQTNEKAQVYIKDLWAFSKLALVNDVKTHASGIRALANGDTSVLSKTGGSLHDVLTIYVDGLNKIKTLDASIYAKALEGLLDMVKTIEVSSISDLQKDPRFS